MDQRTLLLFQPILCKRKRPKFDHFDKDGFDLTLFEAKCYEAHGYLVDGTERGRLVCRRDWITSVPNVQIDHAYQCTRFAFVGQLADQIEDLAVHYDMPELRKLLQMRPKHGIDINLEYTFKDGLLIDLFHYEEDFVGDDLAKCEHRVEYLEYVIQETRWEQIAETLRATQDVWCEMTGDDENDYKARLIGLDRAYKTHKVL